jgi:diadenosine tetraphosphatase ApaH/serine/threonine PP2A family protein phosphatase
MGIDLLISITLMYVDGIRSADDPRGRGHNRRPRQPSRAAGGARPDRGARVLFVNCGSVGKPKDGDARGAFAVFTPSAGVAAASIERVSYDVESVAAEVRAAGLPGEFADKLLLAA